MSQEVKTATNSSTQEQQVWSTNGIVGDVVTRPVRHADRMIAELFGLLFDTFCKVIVIVFITVFFSFLTYILLTDLEANHGEFKGLQHAFDRFGHQIGVQFEFRGGFIHTTKISTDHELNVAAEPNPERSWTDTLSEGWDATRDYVVEGATGAYDWVMSWFSASPADAVEYVPHLLTTTEDWGLKRQRDLRDVTNNAYRLYAHKLTVWKELVLNEEIRHADADSYVGMLHEGQLEVCQEGALLARKHHYLVAAADVLENRGNKQLSIVDAVKLHPYVLPGLRIERDGEYVRVRIFLVAPVFYMPHERIGFSVQGGDIVWDGPDCIISRHLEPIGWIEFFFNER